MNNFEIYDRSVERLKKAWDRVIKDDHDKMYYENKDEIWNYLEKFGKDLGFTTVYQFIVNLRNNCCNGKDHIKTHMQFHNLLVFAFVTLNSEEQLAEDAEKLTLKIRG